MKYGLNETIFKTVLRQFSEQFEKDSVLVADKEKGTDSKSLSEPAHVFFWDEPLNFIDVSRMQIEDDIRISNHDFH